MGDQQLGLTLQREKTMVPIKFLQRLPIPFKDVAPTLAELIAEARALRAQVAKGRAELSGLRNRAEALRAAIRKARQSARRPEPHDVDADPDDKR